MAEGQQRPSIQVGLSRLTLEESRVASPSTFQDLGDQVSQVAEISCKSLAGRHNENPFGRTARRDGGEKGNLVPGLLTEEPSHFL